MAYPGHPYLTESSYWLYDDNYIIITITHGIRTLNLISPKLGALFSALFSSCVPLRSAKVLDKLHTK